MTLRKFFRIDSRRPGMSQMCRVAIKICRPTWSRDGSYVYYDNTSTEKPALLRVKVGQTRPELLIDLKDIRRYGGYGWAWSGLAPDDSALLVRDVSTDEIYALDLELP